MEILCLIVVGLVALGVAGGVILELIGDAFEAVLDVVGPIGVLLIALVVIGMCCAGLSSAA